jgi:antitoxin (DNA-binding transcriptional repressor) of toxin-antitoxin stability system
MAGGPLWLRAVHRLERAVGERVEAAVHSDPYFDFVALAQRRQRQAKELAESVSRRTLHLLNLPAGSDVRRLREQLNRMDRRLSRLTKELEASDLGNAIDTAETDARR